MRIVLCNCTPAEADQLAETLVRERLAACVNLMPVTSFYEWEGVIQQDAEVTLLIKTATETIEPLKARIHELHSYDVPEIVVVDALPSSDAAYVAWVRQQTTEKRS